MPFHDQDTASGKSAKSQFKAAPTEENYEEIDGLFLEGKIPEAWAEFHRPSLAT